MLAKMSNETSLSAHLQNLSFRNNVLRKHPTNDAFIEKIILSITQNYQLKHLDISGMFMGETFVEKIIEEGVLKSQSLIGVHFRENKLTDTSVERIRQIFYKTQVVGGELESNTIYEEVSMPRLPEMDRDSSAL